MNFPQQVRQHKNESDSFAIIFYKLRDIGIFRNVTAHDYGIDFEIEVVEEGKVSGHCIKVQVKSSDKLHIRKDGHPTIGGIKQTTLRYWADLSYSIHVIALCVDLADETIYMTNPLFWTSISQLDASDKSKSITFCRKISLENMVDRIRKFAKGYSLREELMAHMWLLRNLSAIFEMYMDSWWLDAECQNIDLDLFKTFLDNVRIFLHPTIFWDEQCVDINEQLLTYDYYYKKSDYNKPYNIVVYNGLKVLFMPLLNILALYREQVYNSGYYWVYNNDEYLKLVIETKIPTFKNENELKKFRYKDFFPREPDYSELGDVLSRIEKEVNCEENELMKILMEKHGYF